MAHTEDVKEEHNVLDFIKQNLRIDHNVFDVTLNILIEASQDYMKNSGINIENKSGLMLLTHFHFIQANFKNGQLTSSKDYVFSPIYVNYIEQLRCTNE